jgi:hypothetical protein
MAVQRDRSEYYKRYERTRKEQKAVYNRQYYQDNSMSMIENARKRQGQTRDFVEQLKVGLSCKRCGTNDWRVLDFHHRDKLTKEFSIAKATRSGYSRERILQEIAKCDVLCANCHRILHWEEKCG